MTVRDKKSNSAPEPVSLRIYAGLSGSLSPLLHISKPLLSKYGGFRDTVPERLGNFSPWIEKLKERRGNRPLVWIHAVSVGEAACSGPIIDSIRLRKPDAMVAISVGTFTGRDYVVKNLDPDSMFFFPLDLPEVMNRLVREMKPDCFIDVEVELWPNMIRALKNAGVPLVLANGRISDRAASPPLMVRNLYSWLFGSFDCLFMRSEEDVKRAVRLGAPADRTRLAGNLKFAAAGNPLNEQDRAAFRKKIGVNDDEKIFVAGSTHPGEDEIILDAWKLLAESLGIENGSKLHLILAPRHLEQVERISKLVRESGSKVRLWTDIIKNGSDKLDCVIIVNTIGELMNIYGASDIAFVGGSLIKRGGHNVLEPVAKGIPTIHGPSMDNFHDLKEVLGNAGLLEVVFDAVSLADSIRKILRDTDRAAYLRRARKLIDSQMRASDMIGDFVAGVLPH